MDSRRILIQPPADEGGKSVARHAGKPIVSPVLPFSPAPPPPLFSVLSILACDLSFCPSRPSPARNLLRSSPLPTNTNTYTRFNSGTRRHIHTDTRLSRREIDVKKQAANATYVLETAPLYACGKSRFVIENLCTRKNIHIIYTRLISSKSSTI